MGDTSSESTLEPFAVGDVVLDIDDPQQAIGIVTEAGQRSLSVVWENGGRAMGPGLRNILRHHEPRTRVDVPPGAGAKLCWNREQAVSAALRRAGLRT